MGMSPPEAFEQHMSLLRTSWTAKGAGIVVEGYTVEMSHGDICVTLSNISVANQSLGLVFQLDYLPLPPTTLEAHTDFVNALTKQIFPQEGIQIVDKHHSAWLAATQDTTQARADTSSQTDANLHRAGQAEDAQIGDMARTIFDILMTLKTEGIF